MFASLPKEFIWILQLNIMVANSPFRTHAVRILTQCAFYTFWKHSWLQLGPLKCTQMAFYALKWAKCFQFPQGYTLLNFPVFTAHPSALMDLYNPLIFHRVDMVVRDKKDISCINVHPIGTHTDENESIEPI